MNSEYRYILEKGSKKYHCPDCEKKRFVRYVDTETGEYLPEQYGRCDRLDNCGYFANPYSDGYVKELEKQERGNGLQYSTGWKPNHRKRTQPKPKPETVYFNLTKYKETLQPKLYENNVFIQNLLSNVPFPFDIESVSDVIRLYRLGTVSEGYRVGAITFPFIDTQGNIRAVQVKQFDRNNHTTGTDFLHSIIEKGCKQNKEPFPEWLDKYTKQDKKISCLFGEHLLPKYESNPVALVEAPKTAVYGTLYFGLPESPEDLIWLAVYNKSSFSFDKLKALQGRFVYVFPDLSKGGKTFSEWQTKAKEYERRLSGTRFIVSDLLERNAPEQERIKGIDIADLLVKFNWLKFRKPKIEPEPQPKTQTKPQPKVEKSEASEGSEALKTKIFSHIAPLQKVEVFKPERIKQPQNWSNDIAELEKFFSEIELPTQPVKLNSCSTITDCSLFIESHIQTVKATIGKKTFLPYLQRLQDFKQLIELKPVT